MAAGHLDEYIEGGTQPAPQDHNNHPIRLPIDAPPQGIINVIHGVFEPERVCELRGAIKKAEHFREVLSAQPAAKKGRQRQQMSCPFQIRTWIEYTVLTMMRWSSLSEFRILTSSGF